MSPSQTAPTPMAPSAALAAALADDARPPRASALSACLTFAWRGLLKLKHTPEALIDVTIGPIAMLVLFTYMFGGAIDGSTGDYLQFLLPGMLAIAVLTIAVGAGVTVNADATGGVVDRFRSLPVWRAAPLVGVLLSDALRYAAAAVVVIVVGLVMGYDAEGGVAGLLAAAALVVVFAFGLSWAFTTLGLVLRTPSAVQSLGMTLIFLLAFLSNVFVEADTLPAALEAFVGVNPITHVVTAARGLLDGDAAAGDLTLVLVEAAAFTAVFAPLTARLYGRR